MIFRDVSACFCKSKALIQKLCCDSSDNNDVNVVYKFEIDRKNGYGVPNRGYRLYINAIRKLSRRLKTTILKINLDSSFQNEV